MLINHRRFILMILFCMAFHFLHAEEHMPMTPFYPSLLTGTADSTQVPQSAARPQLSRGRAFLMSFVLPGAGEYALGDKKMAALFFGTEAALWSSYFLLQWFGDLRADDYKLYAIAHAGIHPGGKGHQFFVNIENYDDLIVYNDAMLQERRFEAMYPENESFQWSWDNQTARKKYKRMRISSDQFKNAGLFIIGGVVLNHLVSGIDAMRIARKTTIRSENDINVYLCGLPEGGFKVTLWKQF